MKEIKNKKAVVIMMIIGIFAMSGCSGGGTADSTATTDTAGAEVSTETGSSPQYDENMQNSAQQETGQTGIQDIGEEQVKAIVLAKVPGATVNDIYEFEREYDDGILEYEGSIYHGGYEYEFEIDGSTGNILQWEIDD